ncbi:MAG: hypothetical protein J5928_00900 [Firmicutes bacterium]|nr:hypothetical protein [Bacillota bacterium]
MKKAISIAIVFLLILSECIVVYASIDDPMFQDWYVCVGISGYSYEGKTFEPGTRFQVCDYYDNVDKYGLWRNNSRSMILVTESDLNEFFIGDNDYVPAESGDKLDREIKCEIDSEDGLTLRNGPGRGFIAIITMPHKAELTYQYTYENGGYTWGFVQYDGISGWCSIDYTTPLEAAIEDESDKDKDKSGDGSTAQTEKGSNVVNIMAMLTVIVVALTVLAIIKMVRKK